MFTIWFQQRFVAPILGGQKRSTIRPAASRLPRVGAVVRFSVGPRAAFAEARVTEIERLEDVSTLEHDARSFLAQRYGGQTLVTVHWADVIPL